MNIIKRQTIGNETVIIVKKEKNYEVITNNFTVFRSDKVSKAYKRFRGETRMVSQAEVYSYEQSLSNYTF